MENIVSFRSNPKTRFMGRNDIRKKEATRLFYLYRTTKPTYKLPEYLEQLGTQLKEKYTAGEIPKGRFQMQWGAYQAAIMARIAGLNGNPRLQYLLHMDDLISFQSKLNEAKHNEDSFEEEASEEENE